MPLPMPIQPWSPLLVIVNFGEIIMSGVADGSFCTVQMAQEATSEQEGVDGTVVVNQQLSELGRVTVRLFHTNPLNRFLLAIYNANRLRHGAGFRPLTVKDPMAGRIVTSPVGWIAKKPDWDLQAQAQPGEWEFRGSPMRELPLPVVAL